MDDIKLITTLTKIILSLLAGYSFSCSLGYINRGMQDMEIRAFCEFTNFFITLTSLFSYIDFSL